MEVQDATAGASRSPVASLGHQLPAPPNPSSDAGVIPKISTPDRNAPSPPAEAAWDPATMRPETAMKMLCRAVMALASVAGDIPPTPPISLPGTPRRVSMETPGTRSRSNSRPATPVPSDDLRAPTFRGIEIGSPEAHAHEPSARDVGHGAEPVHKQQSAIARKFFSKSPPPIALHEYLVRLQRYCPMSTAVYLAAGAYILKLAVEDRVVPLTSRTVHRLVLGTLRVAMKALEDLRYPQQRFAGVGGVRETELHKLEISVCYLLDFELQVTQESLYMKTMALQQAGLQAAAVQSKLPATFRPRLPVRAGSAQITA
ncbi:cyclin-domain-containing protein [Phyllosticta citrichinensis]|uniref:Cyclin-domain-containing protein n=1 Tax=Phyllosticta citrichinensis TaxID=1130410 RepID=A0ABR1XLZ4_9PEZI